MSMRKLIALIESKPDNAVSASIFLKAKKAGALWAGSNREIDPYGKPVERPTMRQEREAAFPSKSVILKSADDVEWEIYKPFPDDSPEEKEKYKDWRKVSSALDSAANKAITQVAKEITDFRRSSGFDIATSITKMIVDARNKFFIPVADKYSKYGVYDGEVDRQWRNFVIDRSLAGTPFAKETWLKEKIKDNT